MTDEPKVIGAEEAAELLEALAAHVREGKIANFEVKWTANGNFTLGLCLYDPYPLLTKKP